MIIAECKILSLKKTPCSTNVFKNHILYDLVIPLLGMVKIKCKDLVTKMLTIELYFKECKKEPRSIQSYLNK